MQFRHFEIQNYKCFGSRVGLSFRSGLNVICGKNNSGKSALLEALSLQFAANPHRTLISVPVHDSPVPGPPRWNAVIAMEPHEYLDRKLSTAGPIIVPLPDPASNFAASIRYVDHRPDSRRRLQDWLLTQAEITVGLESDGASLTATLDCGYKPAVQQDGLIAYLDIQNFVNPTAGAPLYGQPIPGMGHVILEPLKKRIYSLSSMRLISISPNLGPNRTLLPDAGNLTEVLDSLQRNHHAFDRYNQTVSEILPEVTRISVRMVGGAGSGEVAVWGHDFATERDDLPPSLAQSGTGVRHVLAIVYVLMYATAPSIILIDEPQSFLHPSAVRRLLGVLRRYPQHQFILSTHSPAVIVAGDPTTVTVVKHNRGESALEAIDIQSSNQQRMYLGEIGASLSDVFGADNILWVEGQTEEFCFPKIVGKLGTTRKSLLGTIIKGVIATGDFAGKRRSELMWQIYKQLSNATALIPSALGFLFDQDGRSEQDQKELRHMSGGLMTFTRRRMYENYLLETSAIAAVINDADVLRPAVLTAQDVADWLQSEGGKFSDAAPMTEPWHQNVDAAKLLKSLFTELTEARVAYQKTRHSVALTEWLLQNRPEALRDLADEIETVLEEGRKRLPAQVQTTVA